MSVCAVQMLLDLIKNHDLYLLIGPQVVDRCAYIVRRFEVVDVINAALIVRRITLHVVHKYRRVDHLNRVRLTGALA